MNQTISKTALAKGMWRFVFHGITFDLPKHYEPHSLVGRGTYGAVVAATNLNTKRKVAIKRLNQIVDAVSIY